MNVISKIVETFRRRASERDEKRRIEMWLNNATKKELQIEYEAERQRWSKSGGGEKTMWMKILNEEINKRAAEEWENDPRRNRDPNYHWSDANRWDRD